MLLLSFVITRILLQIPSLWPLIKANEKLFWVIYWAVNGGKWVITIGLLELLPLTKATINNYYYDIDPMGVQARKLLVDGGHSSMCILCVSVSPLCVSVPLPLLLVSFALLCQANHCRG